MNLDVVCCGIFSNTYHRSIVECAMVFNQLDISFAVSQKAVAMFKIWCWLELTTSHRETKRLESVFNYASTIAPGFGCKADCRSAWAPDLWSVTSQPVRGRNSRLLPSVRLAQKTSTTGFTSTVDSRCQIAVPAINRFDVADKISFFHCRTRNNHGQN